MLLMKKSSIHLMSKSSANVRTKNTTCIPPMQKSTISTQTNQDDMKKNISTRKVDADMTKMTAPFTSKLTISSSYFTAASFEDS